MVILKLKMKMICQRKLYPGKLNRFLSNLRIISVYRSLHRPDYGPVSRPLYRPDYGPVSRPDYRSDYIPVYKPDFIPNYRSIIDNLFQFNFDFSTVLV